MMSRSALGLSTVGVCVLAVCVGGPGVILGVLLCLAAPWLLDALNGSTLCAKDDEEKATPQMVCVVGNIGSGKSRMIAGARINPPKCGEGMALTCVPEPLDAWDAVLRLPADSPTRSTRLQLLALKHYLQLHEAIALGQQDRWYLVERDFLSVVLFSRGHHEIIMLLAALVKCAIVPLPSAVLYADASPAECIENIEHRSGPGDEGITIEVVHTLEEAHRALCTYYLAAGVPVVCRSEYRSGEEAVMATLRVAEGQPTRRVTERMVLQVAGLMK